MTNRSVHHLEEIHDQMFFFDSASRDNTENPINNNKPLKYVPASLWPSDLDYDAVRISLEDISIPKWIWPLREPGRNKLYLLDMDGLENIVTIDQSQTWTNGQLATEISRQLKDLSQSGLVPGYENVVCAYDPVNFSFTFTVIFDPTNATVIAAAALGNTPPPGYWRFDLTDSSGDSMHALLGFPSTKFVGPVYPAAAYSAWLTETPVVADGRYPGAVGSITVTPFSEYPSSYYLRTSLQGSSVDCAVNRDSNTSQSGGDNCKKSSVLARILDDNVPVNGTINQVARFKHQYSTLIYTNQMADTLRFWLTDVNGFAASFRLDWQASFRLTFLKYGAQPV